MQELPSDAFGIYAVVLGMASFYLGEVPFADTYDALATRVGAGGVSARRFCFAMQLKAEIAAFAGRPELALQAITDGDARALIDLLWLDNCTLLEATRQQAGYQAVRDRIAARADAGYDALWS